MRAYDGIAVAILAGKIHLHRQLCHALQHEFADHAGVATGTAGGYRHLGKRPDFFRGQRKILKDYIAGTIQRLFNHPAHRLRLLVDFFQHEVRKPAQCRGGVAANIRFAGTVRVHAHLPSEKLPPPLPPARL